MKPFEVGCSMGDSRFNPGTTANRMECTVSDLYGETFTLYAEVSVPKRILLENDTSRKSPPECYGFGRLKKEIVEQAQEIGIERGLLLFLPPEHR